MNYEIADGWITPARHVRSPNFGPRPADTDISLLVIHNISLPPGCYGGSEVEQFFCNTLDFDSHPWFAEIHDLRVSSHLFVRRDGELLQFVGFDDRAWHAGDSCFRGRSQCNDFSIGLELEGCDDQPYEDIQYQVAAGVARLLFKVYPALSMDSVVGHCDIAPGRKTDPGPFFNWVSFRRLLSEDS